MKALLTLSILFSYFIVHAQHVHRIHEDSVVLDHLVDPYNYQLSALKRNRFFYNYEYNYNALSWMDTHVVNSFSLEDSLILYDNGLSEFKYDYGFEADHNFRALYSDNIENQYVFGEYLSNRNFGDYNHSRYKVENFQFYTGNSEGKYRNHFRWISNSADLTENGGIWDLESLDAADGADDVSIFTRLNTAENEINQTFASAGFGRFWSFEKDSLIDSIPSSKHGLETYINTEYHKAGFLYTMDEGDIDSLFYSNAYLDSTETRDSMGYRAVIAEPSISLNLVGLKVEASYSMAFYENELLDRDHARFNITSHKNTSKLDAGIKYYTTGFWAGGLMTNIHYFRDSILGGQIALKGRYQSMLPEYPIIRHLGNHFIWSNSFNEERHIQISAALKTYDEWDINLSVDNIANYVYFDEDSKPNQSNDNITIAKTTVSKLWKFEHFISANKLGIQYASSDLIRVPSFFATSTNAFVFEFIDMPTSIGAQLFYMTKHDGLAYNPNLRQFHLQNNQRVGGFPMLDLFLSLKAGNADLFVKGENMLYQFLPKSSFLLYEQMPTMPTFFRIGFFWKFIDN